MKKHYMGAVYDLTQANMQNLIVQLDEAEAKIKELRFKVRIAEDLSAIDFGKRVDAQDELKQLKIENEKLYQRLVSLTPTKETCNHSVAITAQQGGTSYWCVRCHVELEPNWGIK